MIIFRFANLIQTTDISTGKIWSTLKKIKSQQITPLFEETCCYDGLYVDHILINAIYDLEKILQISPEEYILEHVDDQKLEIASKMFLYLSSCSNTLKPWISFYTDLFSNKSPDEIVLALNTISKGSKKSTSGNMRLKEFGQRLFRRIIENLSLNYLDIHNITDKNIKQSSKNIGKYF